MESNPWAPVDTSRPGAIASCLAEVEHRLAAMDDQGLGVDPASYRTIATLLRELPAEVKLSRLFQVDLIKPSRATLGRDVLSEITRAVNFLPRLPATFDRELERFREMFQSRYERREVPLFEALDEEAGIGFGAGDAREPAPLLRDLDRPAMADQSRALGQARDVSPSKDSATHSWLALERSFSTGRTWRISLMRNDLHFRTRLRPR